MNQKMYFTVNEVAEILQVSHKTVRNLITRGHFPGAYKVTPNLRTSPYRIPPGDVTAFIANQQKQNRPAT